jgi:uncharacterized protein
LFSGDIVTEGEKNDYGLARLNGTSRASLEKFRIVIQRDRIRAAARSQLFKGKEETRIIVFLNKQVAYVGHVSFSAPEGESPLGPIRLEIQTSDPVGIIDWLTGGPMQRSKK